MPSKHESKSQPEAPFDFAPSWRPDQNDAPVLEGVFISIDEGYSEYGTYPIVTLEIELTSDDVDYRAWHALTKIAQAQLTRATPKLGERLRISYGGKVQSKNSAREPYTRWRVENLTNPITAESLLDKYAVQSSDPKSGNFEDDPPF